MTSSEMGKKGAKQRWIKLTSRQRSKEMARVARKGWITRKRKPK